MNAQAWLVAAIVLGGMVLFVSEKLRYDAIALLILVLLLVAGVLTPAEGLSGFSNEATLVVAAMFALNAGVVRHRRAGTAGAGPGAHRAALAAGPASSHRRAGRLRQEHGAGRPAFLPVTLSVCARRRIAPSRLLLPMALCGADGGVCTLLGTSSNLLANSLAVQHGLPAFGGVRVRPPRRRAGRGGSALPAAARRWLLPRGADADYAEPWFGAYVTELRVDGSPWPGPSLRSLGERYGVYVLELLRDASTCGRRAQATTRRRRAAGARQWERLGDLPPRAPGARARPPPQPRHRRRPRVLMEALVGPGSRVARRQHRRDRLPGSHDADVLAVQRRGTGAARAVAPNAPGDGDVLLLLVDTDARDEPAAQDRARGLSERRRDERPRAAAPYWPSVSCWAWWRAGLGPVAHRGGCAGPAALHGRHRLLPASATCTRPSTGRSS